MIRRIRWKGELVGYVRKAGSFTLYSKDLYGWNGNKIVFDQEEKATDFKDKNAQLIFENDVINVKEKLTDSNRMFVVIHRDNTFYLQEYNSEKTEKIGLLFSEEISIKKVGYLG